MYRYKQDSVLNGAQGSICYKTNCMQIEEFVLVTTTENV